MHYYTFYAKDYASKAGFLEPMEDLAYRRMLDLYYLTEKPLPESIDEIALLIRMRSHNECIATVLRYFFELTASGYINKKVETILDDYHQKSAKAKASADARWAKVKSEKNKKTSKSNKLANECDTNANALRTECEMDANYKPLTINQELINNINSVFSFWKEVFSKSDRTALKGKRETAIRGRLKEGYSVDEIKQAILNVSTSEYHVTNGYTDIELICRNQINLDKYLAIGGGNKIINDEKPSNEADQQRQFKPKPKNYLDM